MTTSPIKLNNTSKTKLRATKSPDNNKSQSDVLFNSTGNRSSVHTIPTKQSPKCFKSIQSNFFKNRVEIVNRQNYNDLVLRSGSPPNKTCQSPKNLQSSVPFTNQLHSNRFQDDSQKSKFITSPSKSLEKSTAIIQLGGKISSGKLQSKVVSPPKVIQQQIVHYQVSPRQLELERKVKILESRIGQIHNQKNRIESHLNEITIRLQYQNNFLKQKLNGFSTPQFNNSINKRAQNCQNCLINFQSRNLKKQLQKSEQNEYLQSKQIHILKSSLNEVEDMLSQQISKSLQLLEQLQSNQQQKQTIKSDFKQLKFKYSELQNELKDKVHENNQIMVIKDKQLQQLKENMRSIQNTNFSLQKELQIIRVQLTFKQNKAYELERQIYQYQKQAQQSVITKDLLHDLQVNNQLLIDVIRSLEQKAQQAQKMSTILKQQKMELEIKIRQLQNQLNTSFKLYQQKEFKLSGEIQQLSSKIKQIEVQLRQKEVEIVKLVENVQQKQKCLKVKTVTIQTQQEKLQTLYKRLSSTQQEYASTSSSFYKNSSKNSCQKCDQLRKTVFRLNSYLGKSNNSNVNASQIPKNH